MKKVIYVPEGWEVQYKSYYQQVEVRNIYEATDIPPVLYIPMTMYSELSGEKNIEVSREWLVETIQELMSKDHKIRAIKVVRDLTGWGLRESKEFVGSLKVEPTGF